MITKKVLGLLCAAVFLSACASVKGPVRSYSGAPRPAGEIACVMVPVDLEVRRIDGKKVEIPYRPEGRYEVQLLPGEHRLQLVYKHLWGDSISSMLVVSDVMALQFQARAGATYRIDYPQLADESAATAYADEPRAWLTDPATGTRVEAVAVAAGGSQINRAIRGAFAGGGAASAAAAPGADGTAAAERRVLEADRLERLKFWWKLADPDQRQQFLDWTQQQ